MIKYVAISLLTVLLMACNSTQRQNSSEQNEDIKAKQLLQGIWLDDESDVPLMQIKGDTIYYADSQSAPIYFKVIKDTLYTYGNEQTRYQIDKQTEENIECEEITETEDLEENEEMNMSM